MKPVAPPHSMTTHSVSPTYEAARGDGALQLPDSDLIHLESARLQFGGADPLIRDLFRQDMARELSSYLESGFLKDEGGPVSRVVETAWHADGVELGVVNLKLQDAALVFGFLDCQGVGDTFYACANGRDGLEYFAITIESGNTSAGPYDIYVSPAWDWHTFLDHLPPM